MSAMSFVALILTALIQVVVFVVGLFDESVNLGWLSFIANIMLTLVVIWVAWQFARNLSKFWKIVFAVVAILAILGSLGVTFF